MKQTSASLASAVRAHAQERGYLIDGMALARVNQIIGAALGNVGLAQQPVHSAQEAAELQSGMEEFAKSTIEAAAADDATMVGIAHVDTAYAKVRRVGIFPFSGERRG